MIHYLVRAPHTYTLGIYLEEWAPEMACHIDLMTYEELPGRGELPAGVYIFSDLERLTPAQTAAAAELYDQLSEAGDRVRLLNHPGSDLRRFELLRRLHDLGVNRFNAYRLSETRRPPRFPVFLRTEDEHNAACSPLLSTQDDLDKWVVRAIFRGHDPGHLLIVEFCDTADRNGIYRKYSALVVGDAVIPSHLYFRSEWVVKDSHKIDVREWIEEEAKYLELNPDERFVRDIFQLANIEYGRIDYSLLDGSPQVWEINTNPYLFGHRERYAPVRLPFEDEFARRVGSAFRSLDSEIEAEGSIAVSIGRDPARARRFGDRPSLRARARQGILKRPPLLRSVTRAAERLDPVLLAMRGPILKVIDYRLRPR